MTLPPDPPAASDFPEFPDLPEFSDHPELDGADDPGGMDYGDQNQLHALGNAAQAQGLILGHGYHQGQYEILRSGEVVTLEPRLAQAYLAALLQESQGDDGG